MDRWRRVGRGVAMLGMAVFGYAVGCEPGRFRVAHAELDVPQLEMPVTVAVLADLHVGAPHVDLDQLAYIVEQTNAAEAEVVVVLGDLVIDGVTGGEWVSPEAIAPVLGRLEAPGGVFAVLGNHDNWLDGVRVRRVLEEAGLVVLENEAHRVARSAGPLWVAGLADVLTHDIDIAATLAPVPPGEPVLLLTHSPDVFPDVPARVGLTLAGHTHGGQVRFPGLGSPVVPSKYGGRYALGHVVEEGRHLFVSGGVGTSIFPIRFGVVPRVDILHLR